MRRRPRFPVRYPPSREPPLGSALSRELAAACGLAERFPNEDPANLQRVALFYEIDRSRRQLVDAIRDAVQRRASSLRRCSARSPSSTSRSSSRRTTTSSSSRRCAPRASSRAWRLHAEAEPTTDFRDPTPQSPVVFKIHGDIVQPESIVVTDEDYIQFVLRMSNKEPYDPMPLTLKFDLTDWTTLFVGYSLLDYNLRLLFKTLRWKIDSANIPDMYSVDFRPDPLILDVWQNQRRS